MANFTYEPGKSVSFEAARDILSFVSGNASELTFVQVGSDLRVGIGSQFMTLRGTSYASLNATIVNITFANGSLFRKGGAGRDTLTGSSGEDYLDIAAGGADSVAAGAGNDVIVVDAALTTDHRIIGGSGIDEIRLSGTSTAALGAATITGVERFVFGTGVIKLAVNDGVFSGVEQPPVFDASAHVLGGNSLQLDGRSVTASAGAVRGLIATGGAGADTLIGGGDGDRLTGGRGADNIVGIGGDDTLAGSEGNDTLSGGDGNDRLTGGPDADRLTGGAGNDTFAFGLISPRSHSSPSAPDTITDFATGDKLDLSGVSAVAALPLAIAGQLDFNPTNHPNLATGNLSALPGSNPADGFGEVFWRHNPVQGRIELWADVDDDGQFSEVDLVVFLTSVSGRTTLSAEDFLDPFLPWRGTNASESFPPPSGTDITANNAAYALGGNDTLSGGPGNDTLDGGTGNDVLDGGADNDSITGGAGNDILHGSSGSDTLLGGDGSDHLTAAGANTPRADGATAGARFLPGWDFVSGFDWGMTSYGRDAPGTRNELLGGGGNDFLGGGLGDDSLDGGAGDDILWTGPLRSHLEGGGADTLIGGPGADQLHVVSGYEAGVVLTGGAGADRFALTIEEYDFPPLINDNNSFAYRRENLPPVTMPVRITDFNIGEGDLIRSGIRNGKADGVLVWRGAAAPGFRADVGQSLAIAGSRLALSEAIQETWILYDATTHRTLLFMDLNGDFVVDVWDYRLEFDGNLVTNANASLNLSATSFTPGTFQSMFGTPGGDSNTQPALTEGRDLAFGLGGNDSLNGGAGNDELHGDEGNDRLNGGFDNDTLIGGSGNDSLFGGDHRDELHGGTGNDLLSGDAGSDTLDGNAGDDSLSGGDGDDRLDGGENHDSLTGGSGADTLHGNAGNDFLEGGAGNDSLSGGDGDDSLDGGDNHDSLSGGSGADTLRGGDWDDTLHGNAGNDFLEGGAGNDYLFVGSGPERGAETDTLLGGPGDDSLFISFGRDRAILTGGGGADRFRLDTDGQAGFTSGNQSPVNAPDRITDFNASEGDRLWTEIEHGFATPDSSAPIPVVWRGQAAAGFRAVQGQSMAVAGSSLATYEFLELWTFYVPTAGRTVLFMDRNLDFVVDENDFRLEFDGNLVTNANASLNLSAASFSPGFFGSGAKRGTSAGDSNTNPILTTQRDWAFGLGGNDSLSGLEGSDTLIGNAGNDSLSGDAGDDVLYGGSGADTLSGGDGNDRLHAQGTLGHAEAPFENDAAGTRNILLGGDGLDTLSGGSGDDILEGGPGDDRLHGGAGNDTAVFTGARSQYTITAVSTDFFHGYNFTGYRVTSFAEQDLLESIETLQFADRSYAATVFQSNTPPTLTAIDRLVGGSEDTAFTITYAMLAAAANEADTQGDPIAFRVEAISTGTLLLGSAAATPGVTTIGADQSLNWTPAANANGLLDAFTVRAVDLAGASASAVQVRVQTARVNDVPTGAVTIAGTPTLGAVLTASNTLADADGLGAITYTWKSGTTILGTGPSYTLKQVDLGKAVTVTASYTDGGNTVETVTSAPTAPAGSVNSAPIASNTVRSTNEDTPFTAALPSATDSDGDTITYTRATSPANGTATVTAAGSFTYTPAANYAGPDSFSYTVSDGRGGSSSYTVSLIVDPVNDAPVLATPLPDRAVLPGVIANFTVDASTFTDVDNPSLIYSATRADGSPLPAWLSFHPPTRTFSGTPASGDLGTVSVRVSASDRSLVASDTFDVVVDLRPNTAPVAANALVSTNEDTPLTAALPSATDSDGDTITYTRATSPANGTATVTATGTFTYTPAANYAGPDSFGYTVSDGRGGSNAYTVSLTVNPVNDAPVASDSALAATAGTASRGFLSATDIDSTTLTYTIVTAPGRGSVALGTNGNYTYTPNPNLNGPDSFTFRANDGSANSNIATVSISVAAAGGIFTGTPGDDLIEASVGNDRIAGGPGLDVVRFAHRRAEALISSSSESIQVQGPQGQNTLTGVERVWFADRRLAFDLAPQERGGQAALALGVLLPAALANPTITGLVLGMIDGGMDITGLYQWLDERGLLAALAGSTSPASIARMAAVNVLRTEPPGPLVDLLAGFMDGRSATYTPAQFLGIVANLPVNHIAVDLVGLQQSGLGFE